MTSRILLCLALLAAPGSVRGGPLHDPFVEDFLVGTHADPDRVELVDGYPAGLLAPALVDSFWIATATAVLAAPDDVPDGRLAPLLAALPADDPRRAWPAEAAAGVAELARGEAVPAPAPGAPFAAARLDRAFFAALAVGDTAGARTTAARLAADDLPGLTSGECAVWALRLAALSGVGGWPDVESLLGDLGPWDATNAWALAVAMRRAAGAPLFGPDAGDDTALQLGRMAQTWLTPADLDAAPFSDELKAALGAIALPRENLAGHLARWPDPPRRIALQGWWLRGQRRLRPGDAAWYESLAQRSDLAPVWQMDLWRRASERRLLEDAWSDGCMDLERALELAAQPAVDAGPSSGVREWTEQAFVLALARGRAADARHILELAQRQAAHVRDERFRASLDLMVAWLEGGPLPEAPTDRVDRSRLATRTGQAGAVAAADTAGRARLRAAAGADLWPLWRSWGLALTDVSGLEDARQAAADRYHADLAAAGGASAALAAACTRLADRPGGLERILEYGLDRDVALATGGATPPRLSPLPALAAALRGSQADLHALLGAALALGDMRGCVAAAGALPGTGLTRDAKRRFLSPLPAGGPILEALAQAANDPTLLLAIARNESLFEPAARSRAGALGWMQIMPFHYPDRGARPGAEHWSIPAVAIARGDGLVTENRRRYDGDPYRVLAAYNAGPEAVARWEKQLGGQADGRLFLAWIGYSETRAYVEKVLIDGDMYAWLLAGGAGD